MTFPLRAALFASMVVVGGAPRVARADTMRGFAIDRFEPAERGSAWFAADTLDLRGRLRPAYGLVLDASYRSLVVTRSTGDVAPVRSLVFAHVGGAVVLGGRLRLGVSLPVQLDAEGQTTTAGATTIAAPPHAQGFGDLRVGADVRLVGTTEGPFTAAVGAQAWLPTGSPAQYTSDGEVRVRPRALVAGAIGAFAYAGQLDIAYRGRSDTVGGGTLGSEVGFVAAAGVRLAHGRLLIGPELWGTTVLADPFARRTTPIEGVVGTHGDLAGGRLRIGAGFGGGLTRGFGAPKVRGLLSLTWIPGGDPRERPAVVAAPPPPPPTDRDGDGVPDERDTCPDAPGVAGTASGGCPLDSDGDGIDDVVDACPALPGLRGDDPALAGCPDRDRDGDGVANADDACPDDPGRADLDPRRSGCPKAFVRDGKIEILDPVRFETGLATIEAGAESADVLEAIATVIAAHPEFRTIRVEGHTDDRGAPAANRKLAADRAAAVVAWLVARGAPATLFTSAGFGPDRPLASNETDAGRRKNRRVELHFER